ncbi:MAG: NAD(P)H-dependent oxidoreductase [Tannerellaceae bacterium]|jgi:putative NADPH-quinone reductase|nr:NAD(P)H-dependent oxidoreductase [Tannerellaceae bacterium]
MALNGSDVDTKEKGDNKMVTIVYAHQLEDSLNATIRNTLVEHLRSNNQSYHLIDLYKDGFQPAMTPEERRTFFTGTGESNDPLVKQYQNILRETDHLVFIFPVWFNGEPSIVKAFFERTCLPGFGYAYIENGLKPLLTHIQQITVLTTSGAPTEMLAGYFGNMIENQFINNLVCNMVGSVDSKDAAWLNFGSALFPSKEELNIHIAKMKERF